MSLILVFVFICSFKQSVSTVCYVIWAQIKDKCRQVLAADGYLYGWVMDK